MGLMSSTEFPTIAKMDPSWRARLSIEVGSSIAFGRKYECGRAYRGKSALAIAYTSTRRCPEFREIPDAELLAYIEARAAQS